MFNPAVIFVLASAAVWWVLERWFPPALVIETLSAMLLPVSAAMLVRWGPGSLRAFISGARLPRQQLTLAVATMAFAVSFQGIYRLIFRWLGRPDHMANSVWVGFPVYLFLISSMLYLVATRDEADPPAKTLIQMALISAIVISIGGWIARWWLSQ